jgi:hypothetical protein
LLELVFVAESSGDLACLGLLFGEDECGCRAGPAGAAGAAGSMQVALVLVGGIEIDYVGDVVKVEAAGGDVGCDERRHGAAIEASERACARALGHIAVNCRGLNACATEFLYEVVGSALCPNEDDRESVG